MDKHYLSSLYNGTDKKYFDRVVKQYAVRMAKITPYALRKLKNKVHRTQGRRVFYPHLQMYIHLAQHCW